MVAAGLIHKHGVAVVHFAGQQHAGKLVADFGLHQAKKKLPVHCSSVLTRANMTHRRHLTSFLNL